MVSVTTKLEAVNTILSGIGESPVNSLSGQLSVDAVQAENILDEVNRSVQTTGWKFNTETEVVYTPDAVSKEIAIPLNVSFFDVEPEFSDGDTDIDVVIRGTKLYDLKNHTYAFDDEVKATVVYLLEFTDIPEAARYYITIRAARLFQDRYQGDVSQYQFNSRDELTAYHWFRQSNSRAGDYSMFQNMDVYRVVNR